MVYESGQTLDERLAFHWGSILPRAQKKAQRALSLTSIISGCSMCGTSNIYKAQIRLKEYENAGFTNTTFLAHLFIDYRLTCRQRNW